MFDRSKCGAVSILSRFGVERRTRSPADKESTVQSPHDRARRVMGLVMDVYARSSVAGRELSSYRAYNVEGVPHGIW